MSSRTLDHVVVAVEDLESAGAAFEDFGFQVTPRSDHPFGTDYRAPIRFVSAAGRHSPSATSGGWSSCRSSPISARTGSPLSTASISRGSLCGIPPP
ncbi:MAG: VOC family protein [Acidimicrobiia bacterium]